MKAPINAYLSNKPGNSNPCYGARNMDYEGGYYKINDIGAFGSEVREA